MADCIINGQRCTKCCQSIHLPADSGNGQVKRMLKGEEHAYVEPDSDPGFVLRYWIPISAEEAEAINPYPFTDDDFAEKAEAGELLFFRCRWAGDDGCQCYERRPKVCRGYPTYLPLRPDDIPGQWLYERRPDGEYAKGCPPWIEHFTGLMIGAGSAVCNG